MVGENEIKIDVWARPWYSVPLQVISFRLFWLNALDHPQTVHPGADCLSNNTVRTNTMRSSDLPLCLSPCCSPCVPAELIAPLISVKTFTLKVGRLAQNLWLYGKKQSSLPCGKICYLAPDTISWDYFHHRD